MRPDIHVKPRVRTRIPRAGKGHEVREEGDQSWAVSYADLLMVLLSFFILFFSVDDGKKESLIQRLAISIKPGAAGSNAQAEAMPNDRQPQFVDPQVLSDMSKELNVTATVSVDQLVIDLPDDLFKTGAIFPRAEVVPMIESVFKKLLPYADKINFTIVGHTDQAAVLYNKQPWLQDNIDLSARRATAAYKIARAAGFNEEQIDIKAAGSHSRNMRSLSIIIKEKVGTL